MQRVSEMITRRTCVSGIWKIALQAVLLDALLYLKAQTKLHLKSQWQELQTGQ